MTKRIPLDRINDPKDKVSHLYSEISRVIMELQLLQEHIDKADTRINKIGRELLEFIAVEEEDNTNE